MARSGQTVQLSASIPKEIMDKIKKISKEEKRSTSNFISLLLETAIEELNKKGSISYKAKMRRG